MTGYDAATVALLPCRVCGGRGEVRTSRDGEATFVRCVDCGYSGLVVTTDNQPEAEAITAWNRRALPIAPPAPLVTADDVALIEAAQAILNRMSSTYKARNGREVGVQGDDGEKVWLVHSDEITALEGALARRAVPAVDETELDRLREAAKALIADVRARHPGEDLRCPHMIALDAALNRNGIAG